MELSSKEIAVLCVLMLRGAQTVGEIRTRTSRLETFEDLGEVEAILEALIVKKIVARMPRQPGQKEIRFTQILTGVSPENVLEETAPMQHKTTGTDRLGDLEETVDELRKEIADLRAQLETFKKQFE